MRTFFEQLRRFIAPKASNESNNKNRVVGLVAVVGCVVALAAAITMLRSGETDEVATGEAKSVAAAEVPVTEDTTPDTEPNDSDEAVVEAPVGNAVSGGVVPTTSTPPPETTAAAPPEPAPAPEPDPNAEPTPPPAGGPSAEAWAKLRDCEASGRYDAVNPAGYYGAYQFNQGTWDSVAKSSGRNDLVGVNPAKASPADQDAMAFALYASRGAQPWPTCGRFL